MRASSAIVACVVAGFLLGCAGAEPRRGSVIFVHPDGASSTHWTAARALLVGPDNDLEWDKLPRIAIYRGHIKNALTSTSNAGGTTHAYGVKTRHDAYGMTAGGDDGRPIVDEDGHSLSVAHQAIRAGIPVGLVQSGTCTEPGTGCFLAVSKSRKNHNDIAAQLVHSGAHVLLGGGERFFLPEGVDGIYGPGARRDGRNLFVEARELGYTVVRTRADLLNIPPNTDKLLGIFASYHTFNEATEEALQRDGLPAYNPEAPTVAEMTTVALRVLERHPQFFLVVEEEGTDNFANHNNASATFEACRRADEAIGVARRFLQRRPDTLLLTAADSDACGMRMIGMIVREEGVYPAQLPPREANGAPLDGTTGTGGPPFLAQPDRFGRRLPFGVNWSSGEDVSGGVVVRADGLHSERVAGSMDNTEIAPLIRYVLFGEEGTKARRHEGTEGDGGEITGLRD